MTISQANMTEVRLAGKEVNTLLSGQDLRDALQGKEVDAIYKYSVADQSRGGEVKAIHTMKGEYLTGMRPIGKSVITSATIDRDKDIVFTSGMKLTDGYMKNPVVLPMHLYREFPIGFTKQITQYANHVTATWEWLTDQPLTKAAEYYQLWAAYVLNAVSIGFAPDEWEWNKGRSGLDFVTWELLEHSIVTIPANPDAQRSLGAKQYIKLVGEKLIEMSPIVRRGLEIALTDGTTVSVNLPDGMKNNVSKPDNENVTADGTIEAKTEVLSDKANEPVVEEPEAVEASVSVEETEGQKSFDEILLAYAAGVMEKSEVLGVLNKVFSVLEAERDLYKGQLVNMALSIIATKSEV